jgi:BASS family bile acid:Na+ symporter
MNLLKNWTLPIAMLIGSLGYKVMGYLSFITPYLIFTMLLLTFSKISLRDLRPRLSHLYLLCIEIVGAIAVYYILAPFDPIVAQGIMICIICPTATAAAVVTGKLGGNVASITTYTLLCNIAVAFVIPALFPIITNSSLNSQFSILNSQFLPAFLHIMSRIFPLLICPFLLAQLIRWLLPKINAKLSSISGLAFYMWAIALTIAMGMTVRSLIEEPTDLHTLILLSVGSLIACLFQFFTGKAIGKSTNDTIACGQSLGQKNTILAIWICAAYLNPVTALAPGLYVIWQNIFNSTQLYLARKK